MDTEGFKFSGGPYIVEVTRSTGKDIYGFSDPGEAKMFLGRFARGDARMFVEEGAPSPFPEKARPSRNLLID